MKVQTEKKLVPKLRFGEFDNSWKEYRLEKLFSEFKSGKGITSAKIYENGSYPVYGGNGLRGYSENFTHDGFYFLIGRQGALCGNINRANGKVFISEHAVACRANKSSDTEWLAQRLDYYNLNRLSESSAQPGLSVNKLLRFKIIVPTLPEQQKIATFLSAVDKKIEQLSQKKTLLETYKKGVMQKIFSQEIRFKKDDDSNYPDWEEKKLGEITSLLKDGSHGSHKDSPNSQFYLLSAKNIRNGAISIDKNDRRISEKEFQSIFKNYNLQKNDILLSIVGTIGRVSIYRNEKNIAFQRSVAFFRFDSSNSEYMLQLMNGENFQRELDTRKVISAQPGVYLGDLAKIPVELPCLQEQQKIASFLSGIDKKIELVNTQLEQTKVFKKGLLQQMFV